MAGAWLLAALLACSSRDPQPRDPQIATRSSAPAGQSPSYARLEALMPKVLTALTELGESMRKATGDCAQVAKLLRAFADRHAAMLPELGELMAKLSDQERQRFELEHHDDRVRLDELFVATKLECTGNIEVETALVTAGFKRKP